jgi:hypothetical protein
VANSKWQKAQSCQQIAQKLELGAQKIIEAFIDGWPPAKSSLLSLR